MNSKQDAPGVAAKHQPTSSRIFCESWHNLEQSSSREAVSRPAQQVLKVRVAQSAELISATEGETIQLRLRNVASAPDPVTSSVEHSLEALRFHAGPERIERLNDELALFKKATKEAKEAASMPVKEAAMADNTTAAETTEPVAAKKEVTGKDAVSVGVVDASSDAAGPLADVTFNAAVAECMAQRFAAAAQRGVHDESSMDHFQMPLRLRSLCRSSIPSSRKTIISDDHVQLQLPPVKSRSLKFTLLTQTVAESTFGMPPCKLGSLGSTESDLAGNSPVAKASTSLFLSELSKSPSESAGQPGFTGTDCSVVSASPYESSTSSFPIDRSESSCEDACPILPGRFLASASNADAGASSDSGESVATDAVTSVLANAATDSAANAEVAAANVHPEAIDEFDTKSDDAEDAEFSSMDPAGVERLLCCPTDDALAFWRQQVSLVDRLLGRAIANRLRVFADEAKTLGNVEALLQELQMFANRSDSKAWQH